jgi:hypothetical protein
MKAGSAWASITIRAEFAVQSIRRWWFEMGRPLYPKAKRLLITADCGGSNGYRVRLWRLQLQRLALLFTRKCEDQSEVQCWRDSPRQRDCSSE